MAAHHLLALLAFLLLNLFASFCQAANILYSGETLRTGGSLTARNGKYVLTMQEDCNLVLYDSGSAVWSTNTGGLSSYCYLAMQTDGNLVIYNGGNIPVWASNTNRGSGYGSGYYVLILQKDRNVVVYGTAIWASASNSYDDTPYPPSTPSVPPPYNSEDGSFPYVPPPYNSEDGSFPYVPPPYSNGFSDDEPWSYAPTPTPPHQDPSAPSPINAPQAITRFRNIGGKMAVVKVKNPRPFVRHSTTKNNATSINN